MGFVGFNSNFKVLSKLFHGSSAVWLLQWVSQCSVCCLVPSRAFQAVSACVRLAALVIHEFLVNSCFHTMDLA